MLAHVEKITGYKFISTKLNLNQKHVDAVVEGMKSVTSEQGGTSYIVFKNSDIEVAGKTGTAQIAENGHYLENQYILSFIGIAPMNDPQIVVYFAIKNAKNTIQYGGVTVGPMIKEAITSCFSILNIPKQSSGVPLDARYWIDKKSYLVENYIGLEKGKIITNSKYNFEYSNADRLFSLFDAYQKEVDTCIEAELVLPAYDYVLKCSHTFNLLDARGVISKDERINFINRVRTMASAVANLYVKQREKLGYPLCKK